MEINQKIRQWLNSDRDYSKGVELLMEVSKKSKIVGKIAKGESKTRRKKLEYELQCYLKLHPGKVVQGKIPAATKPKNQDPKDGPRFSLISKQEKITDFPAEIQGVIRENSSLYMQRGKLHKQLERLPQDNTPETVSKREELVGKIAKASERLEELYGIWSAFKASGEAPPETTTKKKTPPAELKPVTVDDLKREKKNLQASLAKDRNTLKYQSKVKPKDGQSAPMPEGPKRIRLEKRIKAKEKQISDIDLHIAQMS